MTEHGHTLLLVEDDRATAAFLAEQLRHFNYAVVTADEALDVPEALKLAAVDAILMDVGFASGALAGPEMISRLRQEGQSLPPVVFISGSAHFDARLAAIRAGGQAYFTKPVEVGSLVNTLDRLMPQRNDDPYTVLVIEDSPSLASLYGTILSEAGMSVRTLTDPCKVMDVLAEFSPELILTDIHMPGCSGIELSTLLRQQDDFVGIPIVFLSSEADVRRHQEAMATGGDDFIVKPVAPDLLVSSVRIRAERYRKLRSFMVCDSLTGLLNHTAITQTLEKEMARAGRSQAPLCFAMLDIDHFKQVNDTYGHPVGDEVIRSIARLLQQRLRKSDTIGRYGGEEFAVVLPDTPLEAAISVMDKVREAFAAVEHRAGERVFKSTFSCGIAQWSPGMHSLADEADRALYQAKRQGRNRICQG